jgi:hypothetical protein
VRVGELLDWYGLTERCPGSWHLMVGARLMPAGVRAVTSRSDLNAPRRLAPALLLSKALQHLEVQPDLPTPPRLSVAQSPERLRRQVTTNKST